MINLFLDNVLVYSTSGAVNIPFAVDALRNPRNPNEFLSFNLLELQFIGGGEVFVDLTVAQASGADVALYGPTENVRLANEIRSPVGLRCVLTELNDQLPSRNCQLLITWRDATGKPLGQQKILFGCSPVSREALFWLWSTPSQRPRGLPELRCEPSFPQDEIFELTTLQPNLRTQPSSSNSVGYQLSAARPLPAPFSQALISMQNQYFHPDGPKLNVKYFGFGGGNVGAAQVFFIEARSGSTVQRIPFISYILDTPGRGELIIADMEPDPQGPDGFPRRENITLKNTGSRVLNLSGCTLEDERTLTVFGIPLNLPKVQSVAHTLPPNTWLPPGQTLIVNPTFEMNNDYDAVQLRNKLGRPLSYMGYLRRWPGTGTPRSPRQTEIFRARVSVSPMTEFLDVNQTPPYVDVRLPTRLEDGDLVIIRPDRNSTLWAGQLLHPATGPEGDTSGAVTLPAGWDLPLKTAPLYALLLNVPREAPRLIGNVTQAIVIDRESKKDHGLRAGERSIKFSRNDPNDPNNPFFGRVSGWGQFDIEVIVKRH
jgi:hypothetical protein